MDESCIIECIQSLCIIINIMEGVSHVIHGYGKGGREEGEREEEGGMSEGGMSEWVSECECSNIPLVIE